MSKLTESIKKIQPVPAAIAVLAAIILWVYVITVVSPEHTETIHNIPVTFVGEETLNANNLTIVDGYNTTVTLRVTGKRSDVLSLDKDNIVISVDVSRIRAADTFTRSYSITYPNSIQVTADSKVPAAVTFTVEQLVTKDIPVKANWSGTVPENYMMSSCQPTVDTITFRGTKDQLEKLARAIVIVDEQNVTESFTRSYKYTVVDNDGNALDITNLEVEAEDVGVTVKIVAQKTVPVVIEIQNGGGATDANINYDINPNVITISGDEAVLNDINKIVVETVNLAGVTEDFSFIRSIVLPDGVQNMSGTVSATVNIQLVGLSNRTIQATNIQFVNVPEGYVAIPVTTTLPVRIRGQIEFMDKIQQTDVRVVADISDFNGSAGTYTCEDVRIYVEGYSNCGSMGNYTVVFTMMTVEQYQQQQAAAIEEGTE